MKRSLIILLALILLLAAVAITVLGHTAQDPKPASFHTAQDPDPTKYHTNNAPSLPDDDSCMSPHTNNPA